MATIDVTDLILGRMATVVAKKSLLGEKMDIVNCEKAVVSGNKRFVLTKYKQKRDRGTYKGPFLFRKPNAFVKRAIRGMLPYKKELGKEAFKNIKCYIGQPIDGKAETIEAAKVSKLPLSKYVTVKRICEEL